MRVMGSKPRIWDTSVSGTAAAAVVVSISAGLVGGFWAWTFLLRVLKNAIDRYTEAGDSPAPHTNEAESNCK